MSEKNSGTTFHPMLISLAQTIKSAEVALQTMDCKTSVFYMLSAMTSIRPEHQTLKFVSPGGAEYDLRQRLLKEHRKLLAYGYPGAATRQARGMYRVYTLWLEAIRGHLWDKGYWDNKSYGGTSGLSELNDEEDWGTQ